MDFVQKTVLPVISSKRHNIPVFKCLVLSNNSNIDVGVV